jgi:hypothetical protein
MHMCFRPFFQSATGVVCLFLSRSTLSCCPAARWCIFRSSYSLSRAVSFHWRCARVVQNIFHTFAQSNIYYHINHSILIIFSSMLNNDVLPFSTAPCSVVHPSTIACDSLFSLARSYTARLVISKTGVLAVSQTSVSSVSFMFHTFSFQFNCSSQCAHRLPLSMWLKLNAAHMS